jgi:hypothetical protein
MAECTNLKWHAFQTPFSNPNAATYPTSYCVLLSSATTLFLRFLARKRIDFSLLYQRHNSRNNKTAHSTRTTKYEHHHYIMSYAYYMPSKRERYYASKAGNTHAIWSRVISDSDEPTKSTDPAGEQLWLGLRHRVMSSKAKQGTSSTCKRCNGCGHFTFECRNHLSLSPLTGTVLPIRHSIFNETLSNPNSLVLSS